MLSVLNLVVFQEKIVLFLMLKTTCTSILHSKHQKTLPKSFSEKSGGRISVIVSSQRLDMLQVFYALSKNTNSVIYLDEFSTHSKNVILLRILQKIDKDIRSLMPSTIH